MNGERWHNTKKGYTNCFGFLFFTVLMVATIQGTPATLKDASFDRALLSVAEGLMTNGFIFTRL
jgi:hypothetical protein